jgi:TonB family protein
LRAIISTDGRVRYIHILKRLPHGLTEAAAAAARQTRFSPATKDGLAVLQSIQFEYSFNLY